MLRPPKRANPFPNEQHGPRTTQPSLPSTKQPIPMHPRDERPRRVRNLLLVTCVTVRNLRNLRNRA